MQDDLARRYPFLSDATSRRLVRAYGTLAADMLGDARGAADLGRCFGADLTEREVDWLMRTEWARTADDVLWRRSKLGLRFNAAEAARWTNTSPACPHGTLIRVSGPNSHTARVLLPTGAIRPRAGPRRRRRGSRRRP